MQHSDHLYLYIPKWSKSCWRLNCPVQKDSTITSSPNECLITTNKLILNVIKSCFTIFKTHGQAIPNLPAFFMNDIELPYADKVKILGIIVDSFLKWDDQINAV